MHEVSATGLSLVQTYDLFFEVRIARTLEEQAQAYDIRYRVYCEETAFLPSEGHPDRLERDRYDEHALQCLLIHKPSDKPVGTVRLVLPRPQSPHCDLPARMLAPALDLLPDSVLPHARTAEISRFSIIPEFRRRNGDRLYPDSETPEQIDARRMVPNMTLGLMSGIVEMALENGISHLCAIIDPALLRILRSLGLRFEKAGDLVEFHGRRQPIWSDLHDLLEGQRQTHPDIHAVLTKGGLLNVPKSRSPYWNRH